MNFELGQVHEDTPGIIPSIPRVIGVAPDDGFMEGDGFEIDTIGNRDIASLRGIIGDPVQVVDHQFVLGPSRREIGTGYALLVSEHRIIGVVGCMGIRKIPPHEIESPPP